MPSQQFYNYYPSEGCVAYLTANKNAVTNSPVCAAVLLPRIGYVAFGPGVNGHVSYSRGSEGRADAKVG